MFADRYGWNSKAKSAIELQLEDFGNHSVGRVRRSERDWDLVEIEGGPVNCERRLGSFGNYVEPAVGDWVLVSKDNTQEPPQHVIRTISERQNNIERRRSQPGAIRSQAIAANIDTLALVVGLDQGLNQTRLIRSVILALNADAKPALILTKSDTVSEKKLDKALRLAEAVDHLDSVFVVNSFNQDQVEPIYSYLAKDEPTTVALMGASGAGKSTLINSLCGTELETQEVRKQDSRGRHTTTFREMHPFAEVSAIIDTPGIRAIGMWDAEHGIAKYFNSIYTAMEQCEYSRCTHTGEQGCGISEAVSAGSVTQESLELWKALIEENSETTQDR